MAKMKEQPKTDLLTLDLDSMTALINDANRLAELVQNLHTWVVTGGFLPKQWQSKP